MDVTEKSIWIFELAAVVLQFDNDKAALFMRPGRSILAYCNPGLIKILKMMFGCVGLNIQAYWIYVQYP